MQAEPLDGGLPGAGLTGGTLSWLGGLNHSGDGRRESA
jgi:hypothetical protein